MPETCFEDFAPGDVIAYGNRPVDRDEMIAFARAFDPQPFHLDEEAARRSFVGRLIASGWYMACAHMRMITDVTLPNPALMGSPGIEEMKWLKPVAAGDVLSARRTILDARASTTKPDRGVVRLLFELMNQRGETVMSQRSLEMYLRRNPGPPPAATPKPAAAPKPAPVPGARPDGPLSDRLSYYEDIEVGAVTPLGEHAFDAEGLIAFARDWDPQSFHIDREAAKKTHFGGLVASGWHTACAFMGCLARRREAIFDAARARGEGAPRLGPSPGVTDLHWYKPTREGETIRYYSQVLDKRVSASRPGWGIVTSQGSGYNPAGERVFDLTAAVFWERRPP